MRTRMLAAIAAASLAAWAPPAGAAESCGGTYTVQQGDTLFAIATRCDSTVDAILEANPQVSDPASISIGLELSIPGGQEEASEIVEDWARDRDARAAPVLATGRYTVESGDSMASIATELGVPLPELLAANEGVDPFALQPGQELALPGENPEDSGEAEDASAPGGEAADDTHVETDAPEAAAGPEKLVLEGHVRKGVECPVLRTPEGETYSLVSQNYGFTPGEYVAIEGEAVEMSLCIEGRTVRVTSMTAKPAPQGG